MPLRQTAALGLVVAAAVALLVPAIISVNTHINHEHCVATTGVPIYTFLPPPLNEALCAFNVTFSAAYATPAGKLLVDAFGAFFAAPAFILLSDYGVSGALVLLLGQAVPICIVYPAFYAIAGRPKTPPRRSPWLPCLAVLVGYVAPGVAVIRSKMGYGALSLWQIYPAFLLLACGVLYPLRNATGGGRAQSAFAAAPVLMVSSNRWIPLVTRLVKGTVSVTEYAGGGGDFAHAALWVFVVDFLVVASAALAVVGLGGKPRSAVFLVQCAMAGIVVGPGAAMLMFWVEDS